MLFRSYQIHMFYYSLTAYKSGPGVNLVLFLACKPTRVAINATAVSAGKCVISMQSDTRYSIIATV